jgi:translation initiation factor 2 subunit 1
VELDEYEGITGIIHVSEVAGKIVRDIRGHVKVNKKYIAKVIAVEERKKFVRLSLKRVSKYEKREKMNEYRIEKRTYSIIRQATKELKMEKEFDKEVEKILKKFGNLAKFFEVVREGEIPKGFNRELMLRIKDIIEKSRKEKIYRIKAELTIRSVAPDGIKQVKKILTDLERKSKGEIKYISAPKYLLEIVTRNPKEDSRKLEELLETFSKKFGIGYKLL